MQYEKMGKDVVVADWRYCSERSEWKYDERI